MTAPWSPQVASLPGTAHEVGCRAEVDLPGDPTPTGLDVTSLRIGWDEGRAPRCTATLVCPLPETSLLTRLDPRTRVVVRVLVAYRLPNGTWDEQVAAVLDLRSVEEDQPSGQMVLDCGGVETRVMDHALAWLASGTSTKTFVLDGIGATGTPVEVEAGLPDVAEAYDTTGDYTVPLWSQLDDMVDVLGADLYDPGDGVLRLVTRPTTVSDPAHRLVTGPGGTLTRSASRRSRESWFNSVTLHYSTTDGVYVRAGNASASGDFDPATVGYCSYVEHRTGAPTGTAANLAAQAVLTRQLTGGRSYDASGIAAWWLRPGMTVQVQTGRDTEEDHLIARVEFSWPQNDMNITTRLPEE